MLGYFGLYFAPEAKLLEHTVEETSRLGLLPHQIGRLNTRLTLRGLSFLKFLRIRPAA